MTRKWLVFLPQLITSWYLGESLKLIQVQDREPHNAAPSEWCIALKTYPAGNWLMCRHQKLCWTSSPCAISWPLGCNLGLKAHRNQGIPLLEKGETRKPSGMRFEQFWETSQSQTVEKRMRMGEAVLHFIDTSKSRLWALWIPCASIAVGLREALSKSQCPKSLTATCLCLGMTDCGTLRDRGYPVYPGLVKIHHHKCQATLIPSGTGSSLLPIRTGLSSVAM